jgi:hypothetical protein
MNQAVWCGVVWGLMAAAIQYLHVARSVKKRLCEPPNSSIRKPMIGFFVRLALLVAIFMIAALWERIRIDAAVLAFAGGHIIGMLFLGVRLAAGAFEPVDKGRAEN